METPINMDDLGVPLFSETPIYLPVRVFCSPQKSARTGACFREDSGLENSTSVVEPDSDSTFREDLRYLGCN